MDLDSLQTSLTVEVDSRSPRISFDEDDKRPYVQTYVQVRGSLRSLRIEYDDDVL